MRSFALRVYSPGACACACAGDDRAGRYEDPAEFVEHSVESIRRKMDQRVPGEDAGDRVVLIGQLVHRAELVSAMWVGGAGMLDELGHEVDAGRIDVHGTKVFREVSGAASDIENFAWLNGEVAFDE